MQNHTNIDIQERTFSFGVRIIKFVDKLPRTRSATELGKQVLRSGTSIAANVEEANGAESKGDFISSSPYYVRPARHAQHPSIDH